MAAPRVTAIVLAAGQSRRMGQAKLLMPWGETTVLGQTLTNLRHSQVDDILVVTGCEADAVAEIAQSAGLSTVYNPSWPTGGRLSSLQAGLRSLREDVAAVLVVLADQPMVGSDVYDALIAAWRVTGHGIVAPAYHGRRGNPVLIDRRHFAALLVLPLGARPRDLLARHPGEVLLVPVDDPAVLADLDRPEDYRQWAGGNWSST